MSYIDTVSITLTETDLKENKPGQSIKTPERGVLFSEIVWFIEWFSSHYGNTLLFLHVKVAVKAKFTITVDGASIERSVTSDLAKNVRSEGICLLHDELAPMFRDGKLSLTCNVEFGPSPPFNPSIPRLFLCSSHIPTDFEIVVDSKTLKVHKSFLSLISPVFHASFSHDTLESRTGKQTIDNFDFDTVKAALDYCYGHRLKDASVNNIVEILRFADKYDIKDVVTQLESVPTSNLSVENFAIIVHYAYYCSKDSLLQACIQFFMKHQGTIKTDSEFVTLPPALVIHVLKSAFNLKTDIDVCRYAHKNGINFITDHIEAPLIESMTMENFCPAVIYAWECGRENLKEVLAKFFNNNRDEATSLDAFLDIPLETVHASGKDPTPDVYQ
uniref:BTB domain-containing protein n=1 Tax=Panagrellus redivivus TaxID=6233 RepID=A0A7E4UST0_PANRE